MKLLYLKDPKTGAHSVTLTMFVTTFMIAMVKWMFEGHSFFGYSMPDFDYSGATMLIGAMGAIYFGRKNTDAQKK